MMYTDNIFPENILSIEVEKSLRGPMDKASAS